jgi:SAM-dependent methyltransferase
MAYSAGMVETLSHWLGTLVPPGGAIIELGESVINPDVPAETISALLRKSCRNLDDADRLQREHFGSAARRRMADAFRNSDFTYRCIDLTKGEFVITGDLNLYRVSPDLCGIFDLIINLGTSEHIADQINVLRVMHDLAKEGGILFHSVPCFGYFNHGLYNYHPAFFILLAHANGYGLEMALSPPHLPFTLPALDGIAGSAAWAGRPQDSGMLTAKMRKNGCQPFALFTDRDVTVLGREKLQEPWARLMAERYDLRVREYT